MILQPVAIDLSEGSPYSVYFPNLPGFNAIGNSVEEALEKGEKVQLVGFGTFETRERAARTGRNPRTKEEIEIPASVVPVFKAGKEFKEKVNK